MASSIRKCTFFGVEPQIGLPVLLVRSVAGEAGVRENGANLTVEVNGLCSLCGLGSDCGWPSRNGNRERQ